MVSVQQKRTVVRTLVESGFAKVSEICRAINLNRASFYRKPSRSEQNMEIERKVIDLSHANPRFGYRRITALLRREGYQVNTKRVQAARKRHGLGVRKKQRRTRRVQTNESERLRARNPGEVWSWDFVADQTEHGTSFRMLSVIDEYTRQCHSLRPRSSYRAENVIEVLEELIEEHGAPRCIRSDNGPEFIAYKIQDWLADYEIKTHYITPGSPWEQGYVESFHDKLRDEFLNRELFYSLAEAEILLESWRKEYNDVRIHSSLEYQTPNEYAANAQIPLRATPCTSSVRKGRVTTKQRTQRTINLTKSTV